MSKRLLVFFPVLTLLIVGFYFIFTTSPSVRYWVDDFCSASLLNIYGFTHTQISYWNSWTGRFSATFFISLFESIGPWIVRVLPVVSLAFLLLSLKRFYRVSKILPILFVFLTLVNAPNIIQTFYWQTGSINYLAPFIFLNLFLGLLIFPPKKVKIVWSAILLLVAGGFSETYALAQLVLLVFAFLIVKLTSFSEKEERLKIIISGLAGSVVALGIVLLAPGNAARATTVTHPSSLIFVVKSTVLATKWYLLRMLTLKPFIYSLFLLFTTILVLVRQIKLKRRDLLVLIALSICFGILVTAAIFGSGYYSMSILPPERALFVAVYMLFISFAVFAFATSSLANPKSRLIWLVIILNLASSFLLIKSMTSHWSAVKAQVQNHAKEFDRVEPTLIESSGKEELTIQNIKPVGELDSFTDNKGWVASCLAGYYKVKNIKISP